MYQRFITYLIGTAAIVYGVLAFVLCDLDFRSWGFNARLMYVTVLVLAKMVVVAAMSYKPEENE